MFDLERFHQAQDSVDEGFADALRELRAGRKTSHWIWYIFPQLRGLGTSPMAVEYGLAGPEEGAAYLEDRVLTARLIDAASAVRAHVAPLRGSPARLETVMGSHIDALKLVSSMTLFARLAGDVAGRPDLGGLAGHAEAILAAAGAEGYARCAFTERALARRRHPPSGVTTSVCLRPDSGVIVSLMSATTSLLVVPFFRRTFGRAGPLGRRLETLAVEQARRALTVGVLALLFALRPSVLDPVGVGLLRLLGALLLLPELVQVDDVAGHPSDIATARAPLPWVRSPPRPSPAPALGGGSGRRVCSVRRSCLTRAPRCATGFTFALGSWCDALRLSDYSRTPWRRSGARAACLATCVRTNCGSGVYGRRVFGPAVLPDASSAMRDGAHVRAGELVRRAQAVGLLRGLLGGEVVLEPLGDLRADELPRLHRVVDVGDARRVPLVRVGVEVRRRRPGSRVTAAGRRPAAARER